MHPGVYCLRTTLVEWDNATLWRTDTMLTNLESVLRSRKTDLGLRPVFHQIDPRSLAGECGNATARSTAITSLNETGISA